jgi:hypothetical protein
MAIHNERSPDERDAEHIIEWLTAYRFGRSPPVPTSGRPEYRWAYENDAAWRLMRIRGKAHMPRVDVQEIMVEARDALEEIDEARDDETRYSDNQPRDDAGQFAKTGSSGGTAATGAGGGPISDEDFAARRDMLATVMKDAEPTLSTDVLYKPDGVWTAERAAQQRQIVDDLYAKASSVPNNGVAVISGGLGGAGKSTVLRDHAGIDSSHFLTVNPDEVKEEMARRGMVPEVPGHPGLAPMERSSLIHNESTVIADMVAARAYHDKKNIIWDITMSSQWAVDSRVRDMREAGYGSIRGVFVDIPIDSKGKNTGAIDRALARYRGGVDRYSAGIGLGGRFVPDRVMNDQRTPDGSTLNKAAFYATNKQFTDWSVYDNSVTGRAPLLVDWKGKV